MLSLILDGLLEGLARLESRNLAGLYVHPLSGLRVLAFPRLLLPYVELPEARQLDLLAPLSASDMVVVKASRCFLASPFGESVRSTIRSINCFLFMAALPLA
jgi:hypothetical protein